MANEDLMLIEKQIAERKNAVSNIQFEKVQAKQEQPNNSKEIVDIAFQSALVHKAKNDENVQKELLESADTVIHNQLNAIKARADQEDKETHFNNKKGACECFGYNEATTEKWAVNVMSLWHNIMTAIWLFIGFFTFAPITFVAKKITVIFKKSWVAVSLAIVIYLIVVVGIPLLTHLIKF